MRPRCGVSVIVIVLLTSSVFYASAPSPAAGGAQPPRVNADAVTITDFLERVNGYTALHKKLDGPLGEVPKDGTPIQFLEHQKTLAALVQQARVGAKQGDICPKAMRSVVRRLLAGIFRGPDGRQIKRSILDEYTGSVRLRVNGSYPEGVPLSSVPPQVLGALPKLPDELEYRFIGETLILMDPHARIIVDFVKDVFP